MLPPTATPTCDWFCNRQMLLPHRILGLTGLCKRAERGAGPRTDQMPYLATAVLSRFLFY